MSILKNSSLEGWHNNTELAVNLKTMLCSDRHMKMGKAYRGVLRLDSDTVVDEFLYRDAHFTFVETLPVKAYKRNPRLFEGEYITITVKDDGTLCPNFKPMKVGANFTVDGYAFAVANELREALSGLVEK